MIYELEKERIAKPSNLGERTGESKTNTLVYNGAQKRMSRHQQILSNIDGFPLLPTYEIKTNISKGPTFPVHYRRHLPSISAGCDWIYKKF